MKKTEKALPGVVAHCCDCEQVPRVALSSRESGKGQILQPLATF
jgi:hypothetical protein